MEFHERRIRQHASDRLDPSAQAPSERIQSFKAFLSVESERLLKRHRFGLGGREIAQGRSDLIDVVVGRASRMVGQDLGPAARGDLAKCAVVALGGYGRRELAPCSDVDVLLLHASRLTPAMKDFVEGLLPLLWDIGLQIGHSVRSLNECVAMGLDDLHARNAMSDARFLVGDEDVFRRFQGDLYAKVYRNAKANRTFYERMRAEMEERYERFGSVVSMIEPQVKEGAGGLRDLHTVGWVGLARHGVRGVDELHAAGLVDAVDHARARRAYDFISRVRNEAHFQTGRMTDLLSLEVQPQLATGLGYSDQPGAAASEIFMRDYYLRAQELHRFAERFLVSADFLAPQGTGFLSGLRTRAVGPGKRYRIREGRLFAGPEGPSGRDFEADPLTLFEPYQVAQQHDVRVGEELQDLVRQHVGSVDRKVRVSPEAGAAFMGLLRPLGRVAPILRQMHEAGLLDAYLREFRRITFLVQHDHYHRYTVDEHTLKAVEGLDALAVAADPDSSLAFVKDALGVVRRPELLALAVLLHDIGKGQGGSHGVRGAAIAQRVCRRFGLDADATDDVAFLVAKHLVMSQVSQRRDLTDALVLDGFSSTVGTVDRLAMLSVLTYVDSNAVGPGVWTQWKATLQEELHRKALARIEGGGEDPAEPEALARIEDRVVEALPSEYLRSDVRSFLEPFPRRYARLVPPDLIAEHFRMVRAQQSKDPGARTLLAHWRPSDRGPYAVLSVCMPDAPGTLARLAGGLTGSGLDILSVDVFTRDDGMAVDVFRVRDAMSDSDVPVASERTGAIEAELRAILEGKVDPAAAVAAQRQRQARRRRRRGSAPPQVRFDATADRAGTVLEVRADDEPGLMYRITTTLARSGLDIVLAKIATEKNQALDIFYVRTAQGHALAPAERAAVERALLAELAE